VASKPWNIKEVNKSCARCVCVCSGGGFKRRETEEVGDEA
jgi:hypothetical protein